ncbi:MAG: methyltransferase [Flaviaesturariibacter sp.]|nr:methyltransferase [Flaviaesturariibacter sp.]
MANTYFQFKQFTVHHDRCAMKVTTDGCLFGAWVANQLTGLPPSRMLDIGTGSGLLSLMVAQQVMGPICAIEIETGAAAQAQENVSQSPFDSIEVLPGDIRELESERFNIIFSNPPFYENELASPNKGRSGAHHDSSLRWRDLFPLVAQMLDENGRFFLLLPAKREAEAIALLASSRLFIHVLVRVRQSPSHEPFRLMVSGGKIPAERHNEDLIIRCADGAYSAPFQKLLAPYYLHL